MRLHSTASLIAAVSLALPGLFVAYVLALYDVNSVSDRIIMSALALAPAVLAFMAAAWENNATRPAPLIFACLIEYPIAFPVLWLSGLLALPGMAILVFATAQSLFKAGRRPRQACNSIQNL